VFLHLPVHTELCLAAALHAVSLSSLPAPAWVTTTRPKRVWIPPARHVNPETSPVVRILPAPWGLPGGNWWWPLSDRIRNPIQHQAPIPEPSPFQIPAPFFVNY
jgi:hypothetical protein